MINDHGQSGDESLSDTAREEKLTELDILRQSLDEKQRQAADYYDQLVRLKADFENFRRRSERDRQTHLAWGKEEILIKQISLLDVLEQALASARSSTDITGIRTGLELITQEFNRMLVGEGVSEIECAGARFDPALHEALEYVDSDRAEGTVLAVLQKGYQIGGRLIRPARVTVARTAVPAQIGEGGEGPPDGSGQAGR